MVAGYDAFRWRTQAVAGEGGDGGGGRGPAQRGKSHSERHTEGRGRKEGVRPGPEVRGSGGRGVPNQNMVVSYLVLIVRLDSLGSTSHVALLWD